MADIVFGQEHVRRYVETDGEVASKGGADEPPTSNGRPDAFEARR